MRSFFKLLLPALGAILLAMLLGAGLIALCGISPAAAYQKLFQGATGLNLNWTWSQPFSELLPRPTHLGNSLTEATPLILAGLAVALPFACGIFNIGAEGQIMIGGLGATLVGLAATGLPPFFQTVLASAAGFVFGSAWAAIPAWLRVYRNLNEIITTIMFNFIAFWVVSYLVHGPMKDPEGFGYPWSREIPASAHLARISEIARINAGLIVAVVSALALALVLRKTTLGYELRAVGVSLRTSAFVGMRVQRVMMGGMTLGGGFAGLAGAVVIQGVQFRLSDSFSPGYGYDAIAIAFIGQGQPIGVLLAGLFFGAFRTGAESMELSLGVPKSIASVVQALALIFAVLSQTRWLALWWAKHRTISQIQSQKHGPDSPAPLH